MSNEDGDARLTEWVLAAGGPRDEVLGAMVSAVGFARSAEIMHHVRHGCAATTTSARGASLVTARRRRFNVIDAMRRT